LQGRRQPRNAGIVQANAGETMAQVNSPMFSLKAACFVASLAVQAKLYSRTLELWNELPPPGNTFPIIHGEQK
jgi:hypothetical protein